jgi:hypothetical protein
MPADAVAGLLHHLDPDGLLTIGAVVTKVDVARASTYGSAAAELRLLTA